MLLSVLDQSPIAEGSTGAQALHNTLDLARLTDALGYHRYWVAEHHGGPMLAGPSPGRLDLGLGRAAGTDPLTTFALQRDRRQAAPDDFPQQLAELLAYFEDDLPEEHPFRHLARSLPGLPELPQPWLLGSSEQSGIWAAELGMRYAFADFINSSGASIVQLYRDRFQAVRDLRAPRLAVATWVLVAPTDAEAEHLALSSQMAFRMLRRGQLIPVPSPEKAASWLAGEGGPPHARPGRRSIVGSPEKVRAGLEEAAAEYGADEVIVVTITYDHAMRRRSYELLAEAFGLQPRRELAAVAA
jgi:luciferase family oxidoreductase group 1